MNLMQLARFGVMGVAGIIAIIWGAIQALRGAVGAEDVSFMVIRIGREPPREVRICTLKTFKLRPLIDNSFLSLCASYWLMKGKGILHASKSHYQRSLMDTFGDLFSEIANEKDGFEWADSPAYEETPYVFCITDIRSTRGRRKVRAISLRVEDLEMLKREGVDALAMEPRLEFVREILKRMVDTPNALETFSEFRGVKTQAA